MRLRRWYEEQILPRLVDAVLSDVTAGTWRRTVCGGATGTVLEIGFGSGRNLSFYPPAVTRVLAVEPSDVAWDRSRQRATEFGRPVHRIGLDGARLAAEDASVDTVVSTWTLCTVPDIMSALSEVRRVLRPGGALRFVEHSLAPSARVAGWQRRVQPVWEPVGGGCHVDRDIVALLTDAGYAVELSWSGYVAAGPAKPWGWFVTGAATPT